MMRNHYRPYTAPRYYSEGEVQPLLNELRRLKNQQQQFVHQWEASQSELVHWKARAAELESAQSTQQREQLDASQAELAALQQRYAALEANSPAAAPDQTDFLLEVLPFVDNLERALAADRSNSPLRRGIEITIQGFHQALARMGVTPIAAQGQLFDPRLHEAVALVDDSEGTAGTVAQVEQTGYIYGERLLRPARVTVVAG